MKFGEELRSSIIKDYEYSYIDYNGLKRALKTAKDARAAARRRAVPSLSQSSTVVERDDGTRNPTAKPSNPPTKPAKGAKGSKGKKDGKNKRGGPIDTSSARSESSWSLVDEERFVRMLEEELNRVYKKQQLQLAAIQREIETTRGEVTEVLDRVRTRRPDEGGPGEEEFILLERDISDIIAEVHELAKYVQLNYTGFCKIIKKHDVCWHVGWAATPSGPRDTL